MNAPSSTRRRRQAALGATLRIRYKRHAILPRQPVLRRRRFCIVCDRCPRLASSRRRACAENHVDRLSFTDDRAARPHRCPPQNSRAHCRSRQCPELRDGSTSPTTGAHSSPRADVQGLCSIDGDRVASCPRRRRPQDRWRRATKTLSCYSRDLASRIGTLDGSQSKPP